MLGEEICPIATLFTTNPILIVVCSKRGLRGEMQATNHLKSGTAKVSLESATVFLWVE